MIYNTNLMQGGAVIATSSSDLVWCKAGSETDMENKLDQATALACDHAGCDAVEIADDGTLTAGGEEYSWTCTRADA